MNAKSMLTVLGTAVATTALTLAVFWPAGMEATGAKPAEIATPKLLASGVEMTVTTPQGQKYKAGDQPVLTLTAVSTTDKPAKVTVDLQMSSTTQPEPMSRMASMPRSIWQDKQVLDLQAHETSTVIVKTGTKLPAGSGIRVTMACEKKGVQAVRFNTEPAEVQRQVANLAK